MTLKNTALFISVILLAANFLFPQDHQFTRKIDPFPVMAYGGVEYDYPFLGGLNHPRPHFLDIDTDGDADLFLQESYNRIMYFENTGTSSQYEFTWRTEEYRIYPSATGSNSSISMATEITTCYPSSRAIALKSTGIPARQNRPVLT